MTTTTRRSRSDYLLDRSPYGERPSVKFGDAVLALGSATGHGVLMDARAAVELAEEVERLAGEDACAIFMDVLDRLDRNWRDKLADHDAA